MIATERAVDMPQFNTDLFLRILLWIVVINLIVYFLREYLV